MSTHVLTIDDWRPVGLNLLLRSHWAKRARLKRLDRETVAVYALALGVPKATGRRRVSVSVECCKSPPDADNVLKSLLDALTHCGLVIDDSPAWCELGTVAVARGPRDRTVVTLEDL